MEGAAQQLARGPPPGQKAPRTRSRELALLLAGALVLALAVRHVSPPMLLARFMLCTCATHAAIACALCTGSSLYISRCVP